MDFVHWMEWNAEKTCIVFHISRVTWFHLRGTIIWSSKHQSFSSDEFGIIFIILYQLRCFVDPFLLVSISVSARTQIFFFFLRRTRSTDISFFHLLWILFIQSMCTRCVMAISNNEPHTTCLSWPWTDCYQSVPKNQPWRSFFQNSPTKIRKFRLLECSSCKKIFRLLNCLRN